MAARLPKGEKAAKRRVDEQTRKLRRINDKLGELPEETRRALAVIIAHSGGSFDGPAERQVRGYHRVFEGFARRSKDLEVLSRLVDDAHRFVSDQSASPPWDREEVLSKLARVWFGLAYAEEDASSWPQDGAADDAAKFVHEPKRPSPGLVDLQRGNEYADAISLLRTRYALQPSEIALWARHEGGGDDLPVKESRIKQYADRIKHVVAWRKRHPLTVAEAVKLVLREVGRRR
jgi:hypothetical protein